MPSITNWCTVLAAISAPLVATARSVIDTHAVAAGASGTSSIQVVGDDSFVSDDSSIADSIVKDALELSGEDSGEQNHERRALLMKRGRGTSRASAFPKKKGKKSGKRKSGKKKSGKKGSSKKKTGKKKSGTKKSANNSSAKKRTTLKSSGGRSAKGSGKTIGVAKKGHGTHFAGMGQPTGGCGVPPGKAYDDNGTPLPFVALNTNSEFSYGSNCGRWVEIELGANCEGAGNTAYSICNGGKWVRDELAGDKIYGYVMDSCADNNFWCQDDAYHLDISRPYLTGMGMTQGTRWNGREIFWKYMTGTPPGWKMNNPRFMWKAGSKWKANGKGFYAATIIYNTDNGIGGVRQKVGNSWVSLTALQHLGSMWVLQRPAENEYRSPSGGNGKKIELQVFDSSGGLYGTYSLPWGCGGEVCGSEVDISAQKVG